MEFSFRWCGRSLRRLHPRCEASWLRRRWSRRLWRPPLRRRSSFASSPNERCYWRLWTVLEEQLEKC